MYGTIEQEKYESSSSSSDNDDTASVYSNIEGDGGTLYFTSSIKKILKNIVNTSPYALPNYSSQINTPGINFLPTKAGNRNSVRVSYDIDENYPSTDLKEPVSLVNWFGARFINFLMLLVTNSASVTAGYTIAHQFVRNDTPEFWAIQAGVAAGGMLLSKDIVIKAFYNYTENLRSNRYAEYMHRERAGQTSMDIFDAIKNIFINFIWNFSWQPLMFLLKAAYPEHIALEAFSTGLLVTVVCIAIFSAFEACVRIACCCSANSNDEFEEVTIKISGNSVTQTRNKTRYELKEIRNENFIEDLTTNSLIILTTTVSLGLLSLSNLNLFDSTHRGLLQTAVTAMFGTAFGHFCGTLIKLFPYVFNAISTSFCNLAKKSSCSIL